MTSVISINSIYPLLGTLHKQKRIHDTLGEKGEKFHLTVGRDYICMLTW